MIYTIEYIEHSAAQVESIQVEAKSKADAYDKAVYDHLNGLPYGAWVSSVRYSNGKTRTFNNFLGNPY